MHRRRLDSPIGMLTIIASDAGIRRILFENETLAAERTIEDIPEATDDEIIQRAARQLSEYFGGDRREFDLALDLSGTEFQRAAWSALADIPYGETRSYAQQAAAIGRPGASRAVGAANARNPIPIVLPCHRVIGADGSLTGFGGGIDVKRQLLDLERGRLALI